jgi:transglycosylase-like protein with SLT domain
MICKLLLPILLIAASAPAVRADYAVLRSGQRLHITGYERIGATVRLQVNGGIVEIPSDELLSVEREEVFAPSPAPNTPVPFAELIRAAALRYTLDEDLIISVIAAESNFNPRAVSAKFARGLMQLLPETANRYGVTDVFDPAQNIDAGTQYLKELLARYNEDIPLTLAAYNAGPDRVGQYGGVPPFSETRNYVRRVTRRLMERKNPHPGTKPAKRIRGAVVR